MELPESLILLMDACLPPLPVWREVLAEIPSNKDIDVWGLEAPVTISKGECVLQGLRLGSRGSLGFIYAWHRGELRGY